MSVNIVAAVERWLLRKAVRRFLAVASVPVLFLLGMLAFNMATAVPASRAMEEFGRELPDGWTAAVESHSRTAPRGTLRRWEGPTISDDSVLFVVIVLTIISYVGLLLLMGIVYEKNNKQIDMENLEDHLKDLAIKKLKRIRREEGRASGPE